MCELSHISQYNYSQLQKLANNISISTKYIVRFLKDGKEIIQNSDELSFYQAVIGEYLRDKKGFDVCYDKAKKQYYIEVPVECYKEEFPFCSHVRLRLNNPYTVTTEFNFNRLIRKYAEETDSFNTTPTAALATRTTALRLPATALPIMPTMEPMTLTWLRLPLP